MKPRILAFVREHPRRFVRAGILLLLVSTWWASWGYVSPGCAARPAEPTLAPALVFQHAPPRAIGVAALIGFWLYVPFLARLLPRRVHRVALHTLGTGIALYLAFSMLAVALAVQALFGRIERLTAAGYLGVTVTIGGVLESFSWLVTEVYEGVRGGRADASEDPEGAVPEEASSAEEADDEPSSGE